MNAENPAVDSPLTAGAQPLHLSTLRSPAFSQLDPASLIEVVRYLEKQELGREHTVIEEGAAANELWFVAEGRVVIFADYDDMEWPVREVRAGQFFGETEFFTGGRRMTSARTREETSLFRLSYEALEQLVEQCPRFVCSLMGQRLTESDAALTRLVARGRVIERSLRNLSEFLDLSELHGEGTRSEALIERIVHMTSRIMKCDRATLYLVDEGSNTLWSQVAQGMDTRKITISFGTGIAGWVAQHREVLNIKDVYEDPRFDSTADQESGYHTSCMLCAPVFTPEGRLCGVIQAINKLQGDFTEDDVSLFKSFTHQAGVAVENFQLCSHLVVSNHRLRVMLDVLDAVTQSTDYPSLIGSIVNKTIEIAQCERASFFLHDMASEELWSVEAYGNEFKEIRFPVSKGIGGYSARHGEIVSVRDAYVDERFNQEIDQQTGFRTRSLVSLPVFDRDGDVVGVLQAINKLRGTFEPSDVDMLKAIASQLSEAIKKASLVETLQSNKSKLLEMKWTLEKKVEARTAELAARKEELERLNREKNEILGIAAHDMRDPLSNIICLGELISRGADTLPKEKLVKFGETIQLSAKRLNDLVNNLLDVNALDRGEIKLESEACDLAVLAESCVANYRLKARNKGQQISFESEEGELRIRGDKRYLSQILDNIVGNAVKYSALDSTIGVRVRRIGDSVQFEVKDAGPGLSPEDQRKLFRTFSRGASKPTGGEASTGLGLSIVKKLVDLMKGEVFCDSRLGEGATFIVRFRAHRG